MPGSFVESRAIGGPRAGIKLGAPESWDGRIALPAKHVQESKRYYPGYYVWRRERWRWVEDTYYCESTKHRWSVAARFGQRCLCGSKVKM